MKRSLMLGVAICAAGLAGFAEPTTKPATQPVVETFPALQKKLRELQATVADLTQKLSEVTSERNAAIAERDELRKQIELNKTPDGRNGMLKVGWKGKIGVATVKERQGKEAAFLLLRQRDPDDDKRYIAFGEVFVADVDASQWADGQTIHSDEVIVVEKTFEYRGRTHLWARVQK